MIRKESLTSTKGAIDTMQQSGALLADTLPRMRAEPMLRDPAALLGPERVVPLFKGPESGAGADAVSDHDWMATLDLVRQVSQQVRESEESSKEIAHNAHVFMQRANEQIEDARIRAETAEAAARSAERRAVEAEAKAQQAEERAQAAERRTQAATVQAQTAEARTKDAQAWAKKLHMTLEQAFGKTDAVAPV